MAMVDNPQSKGGCNIASQPVATQYTHVIASKCVKQGPTLSLACTKRGGLGRVQHPKLGTAPTATPPTLYQRLRAKQEKAKRAIAKGKARLEQCTFNVAKSTKEQRQQWIAHRRYLDSTIAMHKMAHS